MIRLNNLGYPRATTHLASDGSGTEGSNPALSANKSQSLGTLRSSREIARGRGYPSSDYSPNWITRTIRLRGCRRAGRCRRARRADAAGRSSFVSRLLQHPRCSFRCGPDGENRSPRRSDRCRRARPSQAMISRRDRRRPRRWFEIEAGLFHERNPAPHHAVVDRIHAVEPVLAPSRRRLRESTILSLGNLSKVPYCMKLAVHGDCVGPRSPLRNTTACAMYSLS